MKSKLGLIGFVAVLITALALPAYAGWVEVDIYGDTTYISDGRIKHVPEEVGAMWTIFDANKGTITMVNPAKRSYTVIATAKYCDEMSSMMEGLMEEQMKGMPPEQRAMMEQMTGRNRASKAPKVSVASKGSGGKIAGYDTVKYSVTVDGKPYKDVWVASNASIMKDMRKFMKKVIKMGSEMGDCMQGPLGMGSNPENSKEYLSLMEKGWPMREVRKDGIGVQDGIGVETEVKSLVEKSIPASEFRVPSGYKKVEMRQVMEGMME